MSETPSKRPTTKVQAAGLGGAIASVLMMALAMFAPEYYERVPPAAEGGIATICAFLLAYAVRERV